MPAIRSANARLAPSSLRDGTRTALCSRYFVLDDPSVPGNVMEQTQTLDKVLTSLNPTSSSPKYYPKRPDERESFRTTTGKRLTAHQWDVYDFVLTIPKGKVSTYKDVSSAIGGSPRSVGAALRSNPFSPSVPCHRVIAANLFIGGFFGEWGKDHKTRKRYQEKLDMLAAEGVLFDEKGRLLDGENMLFAGLKQKELQL